MAASPAKKDNAEILIVGWNIQVGRESGLFSNNWAKRKTALRRVLSEETADVYCFQEVLLHQLTFLEQILTNHRHVGVGRDDGKHKGEFCPIFFNREKFVLVDSNTFWLSDAPDSCTYTWDIFFKRICTWAHLQSNDGLNLFIFNTHFPLNPLAHVKSAKLILTQIQRITKHKAVLLAGDFNCMPQSQTWKLFREFGLEDAETKSGSNGSLSATFHRLGKPIACIDGILVPDEISVIFHRLLNQSVDGTYPSDHFGTLVSLSIPRP